MAHLRKHKRSPYWYLRRRDLDTNVWSEVSTGLRIDNAGETRKAQRLADKFSVEEKRVFAPGNSSAFNAWVPSYLETHYAERAGESFRRYQGAWQTLRSFLATRDIIHPRQLRYHHGNDYIAWRIVNPLHGKNVGHNTALLELKFLSQLMNEAIRREFAESNPIARPGISRHAAKVKREFTDQEIKQVRKALAHEPEWMRVAFEISLYTGCRFSECEIPMEDVDLNSGTLRLRDSKRKETDPRKYFSVPIHPNLRPLLARLKKKRSSHTCRLTRDKNGRVNYLFRRLKLDVSFHCLRVTFVTRCHRGGLSEAEAMRLVNHSSSLVHRIYSRLNVEDVRKAQRKIPLP